MLRALETVQCVTEDSDLDDLLQIKKQPVLAGSVSGFEALDLPHSSKPYLIT